MDNAMLDEYALRYSKTKDTEIFEEIFLAVKPRLDRLAKQKSYQYKSLGIPSDDFKSLFYEAVWRAADKYNGQTPFQKRLNSLVYDSEVYLYRYYNSKKRVIEVYYLDNDRMEPDVTEAMIEKEILEGFLEKTSERNGKIIRLLRFGCTKQEIAVALGANEYNGRASKAVQRAKNNFRQFMTVNMAG